MCVINNCSDFLPVLSGALQGSILGPLFFVPYINDLPNYLQFSIPDIYADDMKCLRYGNGLINDTAKADFPQRDIDNLFHWTVSSDLYRFNFSKFAHLQFWPKSNLSFTYKIDDKPIAEVETIKDLGIIISHDFTWERRCDKMIVSNESL